MAVFRIIILALCLSISLTEGTKDKQQRLESLPQSSSLVALNDEATQNEAGQPEAPFWVKPEKMEREIFAEPINKLVRFKCEAGGTPRPQIKWLRDGKPINQILRPAPLPAYKEKKEQWQLRIPGMSVSDQGTYTCVVSNPYGEIRHSFKLEAIQQLTHKPILIDQSANKTVMAGMPVELFCKFKSDLTTLVQWVRPLAQYVEGDNGFNTKVKSHFRTLKDDEGNPIFGETLRIDSVGPEDAGLYYCVGQANTKGGMTPGFLHLTVLAKEEAILEPPANITVKEGDTAIFSCHTHLELHKHTSWVRITDNDIVELADGTEVYKVENATKDDAGKYACVVGTDSAHVNSVAYLTVRDASVAAAPTLSAQKAATTHLSILAGLVSMVAFIFLVASVVAFRKYKRERQLKKEEQKKVLSITQWTKKVIIERQAAHFDPEAPITAPVIKIEKQQSSSAANSAQGAVRSRLGSENTTLTTVSEYELPLDKAWEVDRANVQLGCTLGEGAFGKVMKAEVCGLPMDDLKAERTVAVKMLKEGHTDQEMIDLVSEMDMMKMISRHDHVINVVKLLGVCTQDGPLYVIVEYAEHGNLRDFLRKFTLANSANDGYERPNSDRPTISARQLISFARQVCKGMEFLGSKKCIHRDLAARNVLVAKNFVVKIADFGLARDVHAHDYYRKMGDGRLPVKWMAPETLFDQRRYTTQSDVWSFGILLWEIMTLGASPYPSVPSIEKLFQLLRDGHRMECPPNCPIDIYILMRDCWASDPASRPTFTRLVEDFDRILTYASADYLDMGFPLEVNSYCTSSSASEASTLVESSSSIPANSGSCSSTSNGHAHRLHHPHHSTLLNQYPAYTCFNGHSSNIYGNLLPNGHTYENTMGPPMPHPPSSIPDGSGVTYTPIMAPYAALSQAYSHQPQTTRPHEVTCFTHIPYVNQSELNHVDEDDDDTLKRTHSMDNLTLDEYHDRYAQHLQSSAL